MFSYKGNDYEVLNNDAAMKHPETREWVRAVIYRSTHELGSCYVREAKDFESKFKPINPGEELSIREFHNAVLHGKDTLWKRTSKYLANPYFWWVTSYADVGFTLEVGVRAGVRVLKPTEKSLFKYSGTLLNLARNIQALESMPEDKKVTLKFFIMAPSGQKTQHLIVEFVKGQPIVLSLNPE